jgi:DNA processing protein
VTLDRATRLTEVIAWLRLTRSAGLNEAELRGLLKTFGLPDSILAQPTREIARLIGHERALRLASDPSSTLETVMQATAAWLERSGRAVLTLADTRYPPQLLHDEAAPPMLFTDGPVERLSMPRLALLAPAAATREAVASGVAFARTLTERGIRLLVHFGSEFSAAIVNALADVEKADVVAVLDQGPDRITPARFLPEARRLAERGVLVSEYAPGEALADSDTSAKAARLLMASLPVAVLVFEAGIGSTTLATARQAGVWGKDLFALPGSIHAPLARGCHRLIRDGARLVESVEDVLEEASSRLL